MVSVGKAKRRQGPLALVVLGTLIILWGYFFYRFTEAVSEPAAAPIPHSLADLPLTSSQYGVEAVAEVSQLHGKSFPLTSGGLGVYGPQGQITLWVTGAPAGVLATRLVEEMRDKIAEGNTPFVSIGEKSSLGRTIYQLVGMGKRHYYFQSRALVIWLAADPSVADQALREALEFYP